MDILSSGDQDNIYLPLNVGNTWFYDVKGSLKNPWIKRIVEEKLEINDSIYYTVTDIYGYTEPFPYIYTDTLHLDYQGRVWIYKNKTDHLLFDFSLENEGTYQYEDYIVTVKKVGLIETTAGTFINCIEFLFDIPISVDEETWYAFAPNVGLVRKMVGEGPTVVLNSYKF